MDYSSLRAEILFGSRAAACAPHVVTADTPKDASAPAKDKAIAEILSMSRTRIASRLIGDGDVALALGIPAGPLFTYDLERLAARPVTDETPLAERERIAVARQAWRSLTRQTLDVGRADVRAALESFVGDLLTDDQAAAIKALAETPERITADDVSRALRGPWE